MDSNLIVQGVYDGVHPAMLLERAICAFDGVFMIPKGTVSSAFKERLHTTILRHTPNFRCSAARAVLTGAIPGIPPVVAQVHSSSVKRIQQALCLLDIMETMVAEENHAEQDTEAGSSDGRRVQGPKHARHPQKRRVRIPQGRQKSGAVAGEKALQEIVTAEQEVYRRAEGETDG